MDHHPPPPTTTHFLFLTKSPPSFPSFVLCDQWAILLVCHQQHSCQDVAPHSLLIPLVDHHHYNYPKDCQH